MNVHLLRLERSTVKHVLRETLAIDIGLYLIPFGPLICSKFTFSRLKNTFFRPFYTFKYSNYVLTVSFLRLAGSGYRCSSVLCCWHQRESCCRWIKELSGVEITLISDRVRMFFSENRPSHYYCELMNTRGNRWTSGHWPPTTSLSVTSRTRATDWPTALKLRATM